MELREVWHKVKELVTSAKPAVSDASTMADAINNYATGTLQSLLDKGVSANTPLGGDDRIPPLTLALWVRNIEAMKILLQTQADPNAQIPLTGKTALMDTYDWPESRDLLLQHGVNPHVKDMEGMTALMHTALIAKTLLIDPDCDTIKSTDIPEILKQLKLDADRLGRKIELLKKDGQMPRGTTKACYDRYIHAIECLQKAEAEIAPPVNDAVPAPIN